MLGRFSYQGSAEKDTEDENGDRNMHPIILAKSRECGKTVDEVIAELVKDMQGSGRTLAGFLIEHGFFGSMKELVDRGFMTKEYINAVASGQKQFGKNAGGPEVRGSRIVYALQWNFFTNVTLLYFI